MGKPERIFFDMDDTILVYDRACDEAWEIVIEEFSGASCVPAARLRTAISASRDDFWAEPHRARQGRLNLKEARRTIVKNAFATLAEFGRLTAEEMAVALADAYSDLQAERVRPVPGALETLTALKAEGIPLGLVTNGQTETQRAKIEKFNLAGFFDIILVEGELGMGKPDRAVFELALGMAGSDPAKTVMIGDNLSWDVAAPQAVGMKGVWHNPEDKPLPSGYKPDAVIVDMEKAFKVLTQRF